MIMCIVNFGFFFANIGSRTQADINVVVVVVVVVVVFFKRKITTLGAVT